jgi:hypothetical protein
MFTVDTLIYLQHFLHIRGQAFVAKHVLEHTLGSAAANLVHAISSKFSHSVGSVLILTGAPVMYSCLTI